MIRLATALAALLASGVVMAEECPLSAPLTLKDLQSGFAGETGTVWTIAPDCSFTVARQIGRKLAEPHRRGHLTAVQQHQLKDMLSRMSQMEAPPPRGGPPPVNPRRITLSYGQLEGALTLPPGGGDTAGLPGAAGNSRSQLLVEIAAAIKAILGN